MYYDVKFTSHNGFSYMLGEEKTKEEVRDILRSKIKRHRKKGGEVSKIGKRRWEFEDNGNMIGDDDGFLTVLKHVPDHVKYRRRRHAWR